MHDLIAGRRERDLIGAIGRHHPLAARYMIEANLAHVIRIAKRYRSQIREIPSPEERGLLEELLKENDVTIERIREAFPLLPPFKREMMEIRRGARRTN